jgi:hypothetical protein
MNHLEWQTLPFHLVRDLPIVVCQFMVVVMVFTINISGGPIADATLWGFPDVLTNMFLGSGLAMILFTCMIGQLNSQVTASLCMLDFINNYFAVFTLWVSNAIEFSGLLHSSYLIQMLVAKLAGQTIESNEAPRTGAQNFFFYRSSSQKARFVIFRLVVPKSAWV